MWFTGVSDGSVATAVDAFSGVLGGALESNLVVDASHAELLGILRSLHGLRARVDALEARAAGRVDAEDAQRVEQSPSPQAWSRHHLRLDPVDARRRQNRARILRRLTRFAGALADGSISAGHVDALGKAWVKLGPDTVAAAEDTLLGLATRSSPDQVRIAADRLVQIVDPDETREAKALRQRAERHLRIVGGFDGTWTVDGILDAADGLVVKTAIDALSGRAALPDGSPDPRTRGQRTADALVELATTVLGQGATPTVNGIAPHVTLVVDLPTLRQELSPSQAGNPRSPCSSTRSAMPRSNA